MPTAITAIIKIETIMLFLFIFLLIIPQPERFFVALDALERLGFDLPDALAGNVENLTHFLEGVHYAVLQSETHFQNDALAFGEVAQYFAYLVAEQLLRSVLGRGKAFF